MNITIKCRNPQYLVCEGVHPITRQTAEFNSDSVMTDLSRYIGRDVRVYTLVKDYHVDLRWLLNNV
ncbi:MAG: hypothetical protein FWG70_09115 [Oscillospiraceae bacterium]|nr:hypothetical protein [Oscillospiraceae bacterium]